MTTFINCRNGNAVTVNFGTAEVDKTVDLPKNSAGVFPHRIFVSADSDTNFLLQTSATNIIGRFILFGGQNAIISTLGATQIHAFKLVAEGQKAAFSVHPLD